MLSSPEDTTRASRREQLQGSITQATQLVKIHQVQLRLLDIETVQSVKIQSKADLQATLDKTTARVKGWKDEQSKIIQGADSRLQEIDELREEEKRVFARQAECTGDDELALQLEQKEEQLQRRISELFKEEKIVRKRFLRLEYQLATELRTQSDFQQKLSHAVTDNSALEKQIGEIALELEDIITTYTKSWGQLPTLNTFGIDNSTKLSEQETTIDELRLLIHNHELKLAAKEVTLQRQQSKIKGLESILEQNGSIVVSSEPLFSENPILLQLPQSQESSLKEKAHVTSLQASEINTLERQIRILQSKLDTYKLIVESLSSRSKDQGRLIDQNLKIKTSTLQNVDEDLKVLRSTSLFQARSIKSFKVMERNWTSPRGIMFLQWLKDNSEMNIQSVTEAFSELSAEGFSIIDIIKLLNKDVQILMGSLQNMHDIIKSKKVLNPLLSAVKALHELDVNSLRARVAMETYVPHRTDAQLKPLGLRYTAFGLLELGEARSVELLTFDDGFQVVDRRSTRSQRLKMEVLRDEPKTSLVIDAGIEDIVEFAAVVPGKRKRSSSTKTAPVSRDSSSDYASKKSKIF